MGRRPNLRSFAPQPIWEETRSWRAATMKNSAVSATVFAFGLCANAQDKPRVFVQGKGSENLVTSGSGGGGRHWGAWGANSTLDSHDERMEVTKDLQKNCSGATVTLNQSNADYIIMLNRESKHNRGLLRTTVKCRSQTGQVTFSARAPLGRWEMRRRTLAN